MAKQNKRVQKQIVSMMMDLVKIKLNDSENLKYVIIPIIPFKMKQNIIYFDKFNYYVDNEWLVSMEKPKKVVELAKTFVIKVKEQKEEDYWNRAIFYSPRENQYSETGIIKYFDMLFNKI